VTADYAQLWEELFSPDWLDDHFVAESGSTVPLGLVQPRWDRDTPLRRDYARWLAFCEIDAVVALLLGLTEEQLVQVYRSQFAVLRKYEHRMVFDGDGRQICASYQAHSFRQARWEADLKATKASKGEQGGGLWSRVQAHLAGDTDVQFGPFVPPFRSADREAAMRRAYRAFAEQSGIHAGVSDSPITVRSPLVEIMS
jgi:hypothetical protein